MVVLILSVSYTATVTGFNHNWVSPTPPIQSEVTLNSHFPSSEVASNNSSSTCGVFASDYGDSGIPYYQNYSAMFAKLCVTPAFVTLYDGIGPDGFFGVGEIGQSGQIPNLDFALYWTGNCTNASLGAPGTECAFSADWIGYLSNNSVIGPFTQEYQLINMGGPGLTASPSSQPLQSDWPLLLGSLAGAGVLGVVTALIVVRRRAAARDAVILDEGELDSDTAGSKSDVDASGVVASNPSARSNPNEGTGTDPLDDIF